MRVTPLEIPDVLLIDLDVYRDDRGEFYERFNEERFAAAGLPTGFRQDNHSRSVAGVLRGLHYQLERPQGKLVSCTEGRVFDVAVDIRTGSPTYGRWVGVELTGESPQAMWVPQGFAHGFCVVSDTATVEYKCTDVYVPADERGILWSDPELAIEWPVRKPVLNKRDRDFPTLRMAAASPGVLPEHGGMHALPRPALGLTGRERR